MSGPRTEKALVALASPLRLGILATGLVAGLGAAVVLLGGTSWIARIAGWRSPLWILVAWALVVAALGLGLGLAAGAYRALSARRLARRLEADGAWRVGALSALLEPTAQGTSGQLLEVADDRRAREVLERGGDAVAGLAGGIRRVALSGVLALAGGAALLATAGGRPVAALFRPGQAWAVLAAPLSIRADRERIEAGGTVALSIRAPGRARVTLWTRAPGSTWASRPVLLDTLGRALERIGPLSAALFAHLTDGRRSSDTLEVRLILPTLLAELSLTLDYPDYLGLEDEPVMAGPDTLLVPAGTRLATRGQATAALASAAWTDGSRRRTLATDSARFEGAFVPSGSARWTLELRDVEGRSLDGDPIALTLRTVADQPPAIDIPMPSADTQAVGGAPVALVIDARDDHGLRDVLIERRLIRRGTVRTLPVERLALPGREPDRALLPAAVDPAALALEPGDTVRVVAVARDNAPVPQAGRSREIAIAVPTREANREEQRDRTAAIARQLDSLVSESRRAQRQSEDLGRSRERSAEEALQFDAAKRAEAVAERQQELLREAEDVRRAVDELRDAAEAAGITDSAFLRSLEAVREELERALTPELRKRLEELQEALRSLDRERTTDAVRRLAESQEKLREALERSRDLFKRAAIEGELASIAQETKELSQLEQAWADSVPRADSSRAAAEERGLAARADSVAKALDAAARRLEGERSAEALQRSSDQARQAAEEMRQAASEAQRGERQSAAQRGRQASKQLGEVQQQVQSERSAQQQAWRQEVVDALDRALLETTRLAERQLALAGRYQRGSGLAQARGEQGALEEGTQKLLEQVLSAGGRNALVSPQIAAALAEARQQMRRAREAAASAGGSLREASDAAGEAVDALNVAGFGLLRSREDVSGSSSGSGFQEAMERMAQMAQQQGQISRDATGLLPMAGMSSVQQQLQALAARQRAMAQELDRLRAQGQQDVKPLAEEARELARSLEAGRLNRETVARQERLFRRMLDAGRTLQGQEEDENKERQSEAAKPGTLRIPPSLADQLKGRQEIRFPTWDELVRLSPEERRLVTDYFRRLAGGAP